MKIYNKFYKGALMNLSQYRGVIYFEAVLFMLLGLAAIAIPQIFTIGLELFIGCLFLVGGIVQFIRLFQSPGVPGFWGTFFNALLNLVLGGLFLFYPILGVISLTFLMIGYFIIDGLSKLYFAFKLQGYQKWGWVLFSGILSLALAGIILSGFPGTATWTLGLLVGINMLFFGFSLFGLASGLPPQNNQ